LAFAVKVSGAVQGLRTLSECTVASIFQVGTVLCVSYGFSMAKTLNNIPRVNIGTKEARAAAEAARRIRAELEELRRIGKATAMVATGVVMALTYCLLINRI